MDGLRVVQGYLMTQMRARDLVAQRSVELDLTPEELVHARKAAEEIGLGLPGHSSTLYTRLLGEPVRTSINEEGDRYSRRVDYFAVPPWQGLVLAVSASQDGTTSGIAFTKLDVGNQRPPSLGELTPWSTALDELAMDRCTVVDEWYPMLDYSCALGGDGEQRAILQFDFRLLQAVVLL
jgi:hypothetical protein